MTHVRKIKVLVYPIEILDVRGPLDAFIYVDRYVRGSRGAREPCNENIIIAESG